MTTEQPQPTPPPSGSAGAWAVATCSWSEYRPEQGAPVRISLGSPRWKDAPKTDNGLWELTPRYRYLNANPEEFNAEYFAQLDRYGVDHIAALFRELTAMTGQRLVLLCFERLNRNPSCHRRLFAIWWQTRTGEPVPELGAQPTDQPELF